MLLESVTNLPGFPQSTQKQTTLRKHFKQETYCNDQESHILQSLPDPGHRASDSKEVGRWISYSSSSVTKTQTKQQLKEERVQFVLEFQEDKVHQGRDGTAGQQEKGVGISTQRKQRSKVRLSSESATSYDPLPSVMFHLLNVPKPP